jgi:hypothetical protein
MDDKQPRGRPTTNKIDKISALPEDIAKAIFRAANKKIKPTKGAEKRKAN